MAGRQGLEPRYADPESAVLPLDDLPEVLILASGPAGFSRERPSAASLTCEGLALSGADTDRILREARAAQIFEEQDHFVLLILILQRAGRAPARGGMT